jgi:hypothetical protein
VLFHLKMINILNVSTRFVFVPQRLSLHFDLLVVLFPTCILRLVLAISLGWYESPNIGDKRPRSASVNKNVIGKGKHAGAGYKRSNMHVTGIKLVNLQWFFLMHAIYQLYFLSLILLINLVWLKNNGMLWTLSNAFLCLLQYNIK